MTYFDQRHQHVDWQYNADRITINQHIAPNPRKAAQEKRNRSRMLERVRAFWIAGVLDPSLHGVALIALGMQERPDVVANTWRLVMQEIDQPPRTLPPGTRIKQVYDDAKGELLILGEPGCGKTTLLLELVRDLLDQAESDENCPMPVVFNLSSWAITRQPLTDWFVEELNLKYQVSHKLAKSWIDADQVLPLLDGLDEVAKECRPACVEAINAYRQEHGLVPTVVCSRSSEYFAQVTRVLVRSAVIVQPLTSQQIDDYLTSAGEQLGAMRVVLRNDPALQELITTPLMLSVLTLAYHGKAIQDFPTGGSFEMHRQQVLETYIQRMLRRRGTGIHYAPQQTVSWLTWLAKLLTQHSQTEFYIERMQPDWLPENWLRQFYHSVAVRLGIGLVSGLLSGLSGALVDSLIVGWLFGPAKGLVNGLIVGLVFGLLFALVFGLVSRVETEIKPAEVIRWSWSGMWHQLIELASLRSGLPLGLAFGLIFGLVSALAGDLVAGLIFGSVSGLLFGILSGIVSKQPSEIQDKDSLFPSHQGIQYSAHSNPIVGLIFGVGGGLIVCLTGSLLVGIRTGLVFGLLSGLIFGLTSRVEAEIKLTEVGGWLWMNIWQRLVQTTSLRNGLLFGLAFGLICGLICGLFDGPIFGLFSTLIFGPISGLVFGMLSTLISGLSSEITTFPFKSGIEHSARINRLVGLIFGLIGGLVLGILSGLIYELLFVITCVIYGQFGGLLTILLVGPIFGLIGGLIFGLASGLLFGVTSRVVTEIKFTEVSSWLWVSIWRKMVQTTSLRNGLLNGLVFGLIFGSFSGLYIGLYNGLKLGIIFSLLTGLIGGLFSEMLGEHTVSPFNTAIGRSAHINRPMGLIFGLIGGLVLGLLSGLITGLINGLAIGLTRGLVSGLIFGLIKGLSAGLLGGLIFGLITGLIFELTSRVETEIKLTEVGIWLWVYLWRKVIQIASLRNGLAFGLVYGVIIGLFNGSRGLVGRLIFGLYGGVFLGLVGGLVSGLLSGIVRGLSSEMLDEHTLAAPNQGIWYSVRHSLLVGLIFGLIAGVAGGLIIGQVSGLPSGLGSGLTFGLIFGLIFGLSNGGIAYIQHFVLRLFLWRVGSLPWNYSHFLDFASERILLRKVGGGYIFLHRLLLDYFATRENAPMLNEPTELRQASNPPANVPSEPTALTVLPNLSAPTISLTSPPAALTGIPYPLPCGHERHSNARFCSVCGAPVR